MIAKLLRKNTSTARIAGFVLSNFIGLAIVLGALQFYLDVKSIWEAEDSFIGSDYLVVNKKITSSNMLGGSASFSEDEIADLTSQPWVRKVGRFTSNDFSILATVGRGEHHMTTYMFFESIPDEFIDVPRGQWQYRPGQPEVPLIMSKDYLTLYNFGFASSQGLPQISEGVMGTIPLRLKLTADDGKDSASATGFITGFSNRLNTILVPESFMQSMNARLGSGETREPSRLIIDVSSPGDVAIGKYLEEHGLETAGDKSSSSAAFMLKLVIGIVVAIGGIITILSFFILLLSISLIMEKNRSKIHSLLMLGYRLKTIAAPYNVLVIVASAAALVLALVCLMPLRAYYLESVTALGARPALPWLVPAIGLILTALIIVFNLLTVRRRITSSFRF